MNMDKESQKKLWLRIWKETFFISKFISLQCVFITFIIYFPDIVTKFAEAESIFNPKLIFLTALTPPCLWYCFLFWYFYFTFKLLQGIKG